MKLHTDIHELNFFFSGLRPFSRWNTRSSKRIQRNEMLTSRCIFSRRPSLSLLIVEVVRQSIRRRRRWSNDFPVDVDRNLVPFFFVNFFLSPSLRLIALKWSTLSTHPDDDDDDDDDDEICKSNGTQVVNSQLRDLPYPPPPRKACSLNWTTDWPGESSGRGGSVGVEPQRNRRREIRPTPKQKGQRSNLPFLFLFFFASSLNQLGLIWRELQTPYLTWQLVFFFN